MRPVIEFRPGTSVRARLAAGALRLTFRPAMSYWPLTPRGLRLLSVAELAAPMLLPAPRWARVEAVRMDGVKAEWVRAPGEDTGRVVLYLHGGGLFFCGPRTHRRMVARIAAVSGAAVCSVGYRQQPEAPLQISIADSVRVYRHLLEQGFDPKRIVVAGDSTGGFLAFAVALRALQEEMPSPAAIVGLAPMTDLDHSVKAVHENATRCATFSVRHVKRHAALLAADPALSPVNGRLSGLPPVLIQVGSTEMLLPDAESMARRLAEAGVPCRLQIWERQVHVFQLYSDLIPEGMEALREIGAFIREQTPRPHPAAGVAAAG